MLFVCLSKNNEFHNAQVSAFPESKLLQERFCTARITSGEVAPLEKRTVLLKVCHQIRQTFERRETYFREDRQQHFSTHM